MYEDAQKNDIKIRKIKPITHELKTWPEFFQDVWDGRKTFEIREDDRDYCVGDLLVLKEWDPARKCFTGSAVCVKVRYVFRGHDYPGFGLVPGYCILGISRLLTTDGGPIP